MSAPVTTPLRMELERITKVVRGWRINLTLSSALETERSEPNFKIVTENIVVALEKRKFRRKTPARARHEAEGGSDYRGEEGLVRVVPALCLGDAPSSRRGERSQHTDYIPAPMEPGIRDEGGRDYRGQAHID